MQLLEMSLLADAVDAHPIQCRSVCCVALVCFILVRTQHNASYTQQAQHQERYDWHCQHKHRPLFDIAPTVLQAAVAAATMAAAVWQRAMRAGTLLQRATMACKQTSAVLLQLSQMVSCMMML
jgi:hypothetical protein